MRYTAVPYNVWKHVNGQLASVHGALPWTNPADESDWSIIQDGWTIYDKDTNTYGTGRPAFQMEVEAINKAAQLNTDAIARRTEWDRIYPFKVNGLGYPTLHEALKQVEWRKLSGRVTGPGVDIEVKKGKRRSADGRKWVRVTA